MRPKQAWVAWPTRPVCPLTVTSPSSSYVRLHFDRKGTPYFFHNFLRWRRMWNPSSTSERADLLMSSEGNHHHCHHRLLLGEHLHHMYNTIFIIPNISTISTSRFDDISLIVCGRSNPGYCISDVCMFVLGNLSLFCGEVILLDCVVPHIPPIMIMFNTCE
jgi:hypothetical protein